MSKNIKEERLRWVLPIYNKKVRLVDIAKVCLYSKRSLERWLFNYCKYGEKGLEPKSTRPRSHPRETSIRIKERIIELRKEEGKCALKIKWDLEDEGVDIHHQTVARIIKNEGLTRKYRIRRIKYKYVRTILQPGEILEIDVKYVPYMLKNRQYFQFTAIDVATRWRYIQTYEDQSTLNAMFFLKEVIKRFPYQIKAVKTDNHSIFTNRYAGGYWQSDAEFPKEHAFDKLCKKYDIIHYLIDPGKPQQNCFVERSHRSDQETFYDRIVCKTKKELDYKLRLWNMYYNDLKHCGLNGKSPNQMLKFLN